MQNSQVARQVPSRKIKPAGKFPAGSFVFGSVRPDLVDRLFQCFAGFELGLLRSRDLDGFTGAWIAAGRGFALRHAESSKTDETDIAADLK